MEDLSSLLDVNRLLVVTYVTAMPLDAVNSYKGYERYSGACIWSSPVPVVGKE